MKLQYYSIYSWKKVTNQSLHWMVLYFVIPLLSSSRTKIVNEEEGSLYSAPGQVQERAGA